MTLFERLLSFGSGDFDIIYGYGRFSNSYLPFGTPGMSKFRVKQKVGLRVMVVKHGGTVANPVHKDSYEHFRPRP